MVFMGIDIGSTTSKGVLMNEEQAILAQHLVHAGIGTSGPAAVKKELLAAAGLQDEDIDYTVVTGYGRRTYAEADSQVSELSCSFLCAIAVTSFVTHIFCPPLKCSNLTKLHCSYAINHNRIPPCIQYPSGIKSALLTVQSTQSDCIKTSTKSLCIQ